VYLPFPLERVRTLSAVKFVGGAQFGFRFVSERVLQKAVSRLSVGSGCRWAIIAFAIPVAMSLGRFRPRAMFEICLSVLFLSADRRASTDDGRRC